MGIEHDARILIVDDQPANLDLLEAFLSDAGYRHLTLTKDPRETLGLLCATAPDLLVLDLHMPHMDGYEVMEKIRRAVPPEDAAPILVLTADATAETRRKALGAGARDFLTKPLDEVETLLRIRNMLEARALHLELRARNIALERTVAQLAAERETSERLLLNVLPRTIAERLKVRSATIADSFESVTVLFADIVNFSRFSEHLPAEQLVSWLNEVFSVFDDLVETFQLEKIKTIGDAYMLAGGLPEPREDHAEAVADLALCLQQEMSRRRTPAGDPLQLRIGIHTGRVAAGVIGRRKFAYDLWGDTVNTASRMQTHGVEGGIHVSAATYERLRGRFRFENRGEIPVKSKGTLRTYLLLGRDAELAPAAGVTVS